MNATAEKKKSRRTRSLAALETNGGADMSSSHSETSQSDTVLAQLSPYLVASFRQLYPNRSAHTGGTALPAGRVTARTDFCLPVDRPLALGRCVLAALDLACIHPPPSFPACLLDESSSFWLFAADRERLRDCAGASSTGGVQKHPDRVDRWRHSHAASLCSRSASSRTSASATTGTAASFVARCPSPSPSCA